MFPGRVLPEFLIGFSYAREILCFMVHGLMPVGLSDAEKCVTGVTSWWK